jgi:tetratricopeptide (TPR) repeat protein
MSDPLPAPRLRSSKIAAIAPLFVGVLLGFIGGYFAGGGGRPSFPGTGSSSLAAGQPGGPIETLTAQIERDPENPKLWAALGNAYYDRENWDRAIEAYKKALRKAPKDAAILSDIGAAYRNRGEFKRAIASFAKAKAADPAHWQALLNIVLLQAFDAKNPEAAQKAFEELKQKYPDIPNLDRIQERISRLRAG